MPTNEQTAWNEAGHIVWSWQHDLGIWSSSIREGLTDSGAPFFGATEPVPGSSTHDEEASYQLAGLAGEILGSEHDGYVVGDHFLHNDSQRAAWHLWQRDGAGGDGSEESARRHLSEALERLPAIKTALAADVRLPRVVAALLKHGTLDHDQLEELRASSKQGA